MEIGFVLLVFLIGLIMIVKGGDWFVDSSIWIAEKTGISFGIIGATIVSLATTLPELFVSSIASREGFTDMAIGNSLGSIICNIAVVIGICALLNPMTIKDDFFGIKGIMMLSYLSIFYIFAADGLISHVEGKILLALIIPFILINIFEHNKSNGKLRDKNKKPSKKGEFSMVIIKFIVGAFLIVYGADLLVDTGVEIANILRIPKQIISLTLLALGTSLPELVTAISSLFKGKESISLGNVLGSNILNLSLVMGISTLVSSDGLIISNQSLFLDIPVAFFVSLIFILSAVFFNKISRFIGIILLGTYIGYLVILF